jgi:hypothetical protein
MKWWSRLWRNSTVAHRESSQWVRITLPGWNEDTSNKDSRTWRDIDGDLLSLDIPTEALHLPNKELELTRWCRELAQRRRGGLIEARAVDSGIRPSVRLVYKRLQIRAYVYTGMFISHVEGFTLIWTIVAGERGTTGVREAVVTSNLMNAGKLTLDDYRSGWARDPYEPAYQGVDRSVLRFISDDESYDEQFPQHPLSKVRRVLRALPAAIQLDTQKPQSSIS